MDLKLQGKYLKTVTLRYLRTDISNSMDFPGGSDGKAFPYNAGDQDSVPGLGKYHGEGNGNPLQCSCLENSMDRGAWWTAVYGVTKNGTQLSD